MRHGALILGRFEAVHQIGEKAHVRLVERAVRREIGERLRRQPERAAHRLRRPRGERLAGAFEHLHHAEEADGIAPRDAVVHVGDHELGRRPGRPAAHRHRVAAGCGDVVQDPFLVAGLFGDVVRDGTAQPGVRLGQAAAAGHQQRHRMLDVVIGLGEEGEVLRPRHAPCEAVLNDGHREQLGARRCGAALQDIKKGHSIRLRIGLDLGNGIRGARRSATRRLRAAGGRSASPSRPRVRTAHRRGSRRRAARSRAAAH